MFGFIGKLASTVGRGIQKAARFTGDALRKVGETCKEALHYVAAHGPGIVETVKKGIEVAKQVVSGLKQGLEVVIKTKIGMNPKWGPLLRGAIAGLDALGNILEHKALQNIEEYLEKALKLASEGVDLLLKAADLADIIANRQNIRNTRQQAKGAGSTTFDTVDYIYSTAITRTKIKDALDTGAINSFEDYMGLKASQKLLSLSQEKVQSGQQIHIDPDDLTLLRAAENMLGADEDISNETLINVDAIIQKRQGRGLYPFVFEELITGWQGRINTLAEENKTLSDSIIKNEITIEDMEGDALLEDLTKEQSCKLESLKTQYSRDTRIREEQRYVINSLQAYIHASEGLLQYLENPEQFAEEKEYLVERVNDVAHLIIQSAQQERPLSELSEEDQYTIINFANLFAEASKERTKRNELVEIAL